MDLNPHIATPEPYALDTLFNLSDPHFDPSKMGVLTQDFCDSRMHESA